MKSVRTFGNAGQDMEISRLWREIKKLEEEVSLIKLETTITAEPGGILGPVHPPAPPVAVAPELDDISLADYCSEGVGNYAGNVNGLRAAVADAISEGKRLFIPRGWWEFNWTPTDFQTVIDGDLTILGVGADSVMKFLPDAPFAAGFDARTTGTAIVFQVKAAANIRFEIRDVTFRSFDTPDFSKVSNIGSWESWAIVGVELEGVTAPTTDGYSHQIIFERARTEGYWAIVVGSGAWGNELATRRDYVYMNACYFEAAQIAAGTSWPTATGDSTKIIIARGCNFVSKWQDSTAAFGRAFYVQSGVSLSVTDCDFDGYLTCVRHSESGTYTGGVVSVVSGCTARRSQTDGAFFSGSSGYSRALITGCSVSKNVDVFVGTTQGSITVVGCQVYCPTVLGTNTDDVEPTDLTKVIFRDCVFAQASQTTPIEIQFGQAGEVLFENCNIEYTGTATFAYMLTAGTLRFKACRIRLASGSGSFYLHGRNSGVTVNVYIEDCDIELVGNGQAFMRNLGTDNPTLHLNRNRFVNSGTRTLMVSNQATPPTDTILGADNEFVGLNQYFIELSAPAISLGRQRLQLRRMAYGSAIASAGTLILDPSYDVYRISGTTTIDNIYFTTDATLRLEALKMFSGSRITLIPTGAWALSGAGNITAESAAQTVNRPITLIYDETIGEWMELKGTTYTDEMAQDAVGSILADAGSIDFTYSDATPSISAQLVGDAGSPGNSKYYGTDGTGTKGFHAVPGAGAGDFLLDLWYVNNLTGTTGGETPMDKMGDAEHDAYDREYVAHFDGTIVGLGVRSNAARTAGTFTAVPSVNGVAVGGGGIQVDLDGSVTQFDNDSGSAAFVAGDRLGILYQTAGWTPTTADLRAGLRITVT